MNHQPNIQVLITELFKMINNLWPLIMDTMFTLRLNNSNLRNLQKFAIERKKTMKCS